MARPLSLDREAANLIISILQIPQTIETACAAAGVKERTFYRWQREGKKLERQLEKEPAPLSDDEQTLLQFWQATKKARAVGKVALLNIISGVANNAHEPKRWQAAAWLLERMYPQEFGRRYIKLEASGPDGGPIQHSGPGGAPLSVSVVFEGGRPETPAVITQPPPDGDDEPGD